MSKRILCKFFVNGACLKGEYCEFSHDWKDPPNNVCTYYQKGFCAYGSRCRYKHVKVSEQPSLPSSSAPAQHLLSASPPTTLSPGMLANGAGLLSGISSVSGQPFYPPNQPIWSENSEHHDVAVIDNTVELKRMNPADRSICSFAAAGKCPRGENCPYIHGDLCPLCAKNCLHPFRPLEREEHIKICEKRQKRLELLKHSREIECSVCFERVLSKTTAAERKFGILFECDHPFCISCIRNWRSGTPSSGVDINSTFRTCPVCRKLSYFVIPSVIWFSTKEEKQIILDSYKAKLRCPVGIDKEGILFSDDTLRALVQTTVTDLNLTQTKSLVFKGEEYRGWPITHRVLNREPIVLWGFLHFQKKSIDCKHYDFGNGTCPFRNSCFYKHQYRDGRLEEVVPRHLSHENGST